MARTESRAFDAYFDPVWASSANPGPPQPHFDAKTQVAAGRYKYCQRPLVAHLEPVQSTVLLAPSAAPKEEDVIGEGRVKDAGTQSVYRESEAQTDPYSPEYVVPKGTDPEVLLLEGLKYGQGLPAGAREVEKIEHARAKRHLEAHLPPATDECSLALRRRLLEWQEMKEFNFKQKEIDDAHSRRLGLLRHAINERDQDREFLAEQRVETLRQKRGEVRDRALEGIQAQRIKTLRKLSLARGRLQLPASETPVVALSGKDARRKRGNRDIISEYANYSSAVYAPVTRTGTKLDKESHVFDVTRVAPHLGGHGVLNALGDAPHPRLTETFVRVPVARADLPAKTAEDRHKAQIAHDLETMTVVLQDERDPVAAKIRKASEGTQLPPWSPSKQNVEKPPTPVDAVVDEAAAQLQEAVDFFEPLIQTGAAALDAARRGDEAVDAAREDHDDAEVVAARDRARVERGAADSIAGAVASSLLDFLAKELVREEEKDRVLTLARRADIERKSREAEETGRREAEERLQARSDD